MVEGMTTCSSLAESWPNRDPRGFGVHNHVLGGRLRTPLRYMGTKRSLAPLVRREIDALRPSGLVADLFSGLGSVAQAMASDHPVLVNDGLAFTAPLARARFLEPEEPRPRLDGLLSALHLDYRLRVEALAFRFEERIAREAEAVEEGPLGLAAYLEAVEHVGNSGGFQQRSRIAAGRRDAGRYVLVALYYSGGYFSTRQAIELDALRLAIDSHGSSSDWLLAAWLAAAATIINAPGHTAQYLKPTTPAAFQRIRRQWARPVWPVFVSKLEEIVLVGNRAWRTANVVCQDDALTLLSSGRLESVGAVYADPPYTKDQYSRYYHLYETLYRYDFPDSTGAGRYRSDRFTSAFSLASEVESAFWRLLEGVARLGAPLVLSYPARSLLSRRGVEIRDLIASFFRLERETVLDYRHSTMGASQGRSHLSAQEQLFVCLPREAFRRH